MKLFTIGYGGKNPTDFISILKSRDVRSVVDVRLRPDKACMGNYTRAKAQDKGIRALLSKAGIEYFSFIEMGCMFYECADWEERYARLIARAGDLLVERIEEVPHPMVLMCSEAKPSECHRRLLAAYLCSSRGWEPVHL